MTLYSDQDATRKGKSVHSILIGESFTGRCNPKMLGQKKATEVANL